MKDLLHEIDEDGSGEIEFGEFCQLCATFLVEDPDMETMKRELKDAFRLVGQTYSSRWKFWSKNHHSTGCTTRRASATSPPTP